MIMTVLEGQVEEAKASLLVTAYNKAVKELEPGMVETYLVHDRKDPLIWRILTVWESPEVLEKMRSQGTPKGVLMFREAGTEPTLSIFTIESQAKV